jgi:hypothetical protein
MKSIYNKILLLLIVFINISLFAVAQSDPWIAVNAAGTQATSVVPNKVPDVVNMYQINWKSFSQQFYADTITNQPINITIPTPQNSRMNFIVTDANILSKETQAYFPDVKAYKGFAVDGQGATIRITISNLGLIIDVSNRENSFSITSMYKNDPDFYYVYNKKDAPGYKTATLECLEKDIVKSAAARPVNSPTTLSVGDCQLRTYRLAVAATDEYTASVGSVANAIATITATVNGINAIYEEAATIHFILVTSPAIIFNTGGADPYPTQSGPDATYLQTNNTVLTSALGDANYDLGIVFNGDIAWAPGGGKGLGILGGTCTSGAKGEAAAGGQVCTGPSFVNCAAHEIGHLFGATHTFASTNGGCNGNVSLSTSYEPGSGSTIMSYAGVCPGTDYQSLPDNYFHAGSAEEIELFSIYAGTCAIITPIANHSPVVAVSGTTYNIPVSTPFKLTATATDADNDILNYCWEEVDVASVAQTTSPAATATDGPSFRSFPPVSSGVRYFPNLPSLAAGTATPYEVLPSIARSLNFVITARDNAAGGGCADELALIVNTTNAAAGAFKVTSQNTATALVANGVTTFNITWAVAGTNLAPINTTNVNILYSTDNGLTYPYTIAANVPNTGAATLLVPNIPSCAGRIMIAAVNNIFFNINAAPITITSSCAADGATFTSDSAKVYSAGSPSLAFSLTPQYTAPYTLPITGALAVTDPTTYMSNITAGACLAYNGNVANYKTYNIRASQSGNYVFNVSATGGSLFPVLNLYNGTYSPNALACTNFLASTYTHAVGSAAFTQSLCPGINYTLVINGFGPTQTVGSYSISITPPAGASVSSGEPTPVGYDYKYVIVDNATGKIVAINATADLSTYPPGQYNINGLSYTTGLDLSSYVGGLYTKITTDAQNFIVCGNISEDQKLVTIGPGTVLSQGFLSFTGVLNNDHALLTWKTGSEQNSKGFEVMRSYDGQSFENIGFVNGAGNSIDVNNYSFTDPATAKNSQYYKISEVDNDNEEKLTSSIVFLQDQTVKVFIQNTSTASTNMLLKTGNMFDSRTSLNISFIDNLGRTVKKVSVPYQDQLIDVSDLIPGVYFIQIVDNNYKEYYSNKIVRY